MNNDSYFNNKRIEMLPFIPKTASKILEIGCGEGCFIEEIKRIQNIEAWGVELDPTAAKIVAPKLYKVFNCSIEEAVKQLPEGYFDCIVFNDVLEHLINPGAILESMKSLLNNNGVVVVSIPNVRFLPNIYQLLYQKDWKYDERGGILDITHLRFFTEKSIVRMFENCGYAIEKIQGINPIELLKYKLIIGLSFGFLRDTRFMQFACVAKLK